MPVVTACLWREAGDDRWRTGVIDFPEGPNDPDGSAGLFRLLIDPSPEAFKAFAQDYYEVPVDLAAVRNVYGRQPLTQEVINALNPELTLQDLAEEIAVIKYPSVSG